MPHFLLFHSLVAASSTTSKSKSSSTLPFLIILVLFALAYIFFIRPRSRRMKQQTTTTTNLSIGDEVISAGGILGTVTAIAGDEISVEVSPGTVLTFWRRAINLRTAVKGAPQSTVRSPLDDDPAHADSYYEDEPYGDDVESSYEDEHPADGAAPDAGEQPDDGHDGESGGLTGDAPDGSSGDR